jgi:hypothetical protein
VVASGALCILHNVRKPELPYAPALAPPDALTPLSPHSPDEALSFRRDLRDSDIAISSLSWIARGGDGEPDG